METIKKILWFLLKLLWKIFLILLWGAARLAELIFGLIGQLLQHYVNKPNNTRYK